jgi:hypothetical protein
MTNFRGPLITDYAQTIFETEKRALTGDQHAVIEIVSLLRKMRAGMEKLEQRRNGDQTIEACAANDVFGELHEYLEMMYGEAGR